MGLKRVKDVVVLRYGHRHVRDYRVSSHCGLVARAFGAKKIVIVGEEDLELKGSIDRVTENWGGDFEVEFSGNWEKEFEKYRKLGYKIVHTTMYGLPLQDEVGKIRAAEKVLLVLGSQKVEKAVYEQADYNISVTQQPHSEIAALAVFLHEYFEGGELGRGFKGAKKKIVPLERGKRVISQ